MNRVSALLIAATIFAIGATACSAETVVGQAMLSAHESAGQAVIYLDSSAKSKPLAHASVDQRDKTFEPHISVVTRGTTVHFPNDDTVFHNVFAYFQAKKFDLGMYPRGSSKQVTFDKTGLVVLLCNVHPDMSAYIMVVDTPYYAVADSHGRFHISGVPPGEYTLHGWHESGSALSESITIKPGGGPLAVTLAKK